MKKSLITTIVLTALVAVAVAGCASKEPEETEVVTVPETTVEQTEAPAPSEDPLAPIIVSTSEQASDVPDAFPTGVPLNQDAYTEFSEPVMYEVIEDCITWSGNDVQTSGGDLYTGSLVTAVASDGNYLILDDQRVVEASHLQLFE
ncbi:MAG: hypothetical protein IJ757_05760 [Clostridiales bacterium]|nr:hypothetical protein [Clostridiales bacterium]